MKMVVNPQVVVRNNTEIPPMVIYSKQESQTGYWRWHTQDTEHFQHHNDPSLLCTFYNLTHFSTHSNLLPKL
jgi:hypothetical protein